MKDIPLDPFLSICVSLYGSTSTFVLVWNRVGEYNIIDGPCNGTLPESKISWLYNIKTIWIDFIFPSQLVITRTVLNAASMILSGKIFLKIDNVHMD